MKWELTKQKYLTQSEIDKLFSTVRKLESEELLFLEVAEDYAVVAKNALEAVQVKETSHNVG